MATKFITPSWRMPKNSNQSKASNYSIEFAGSTEYISSVVSELNSSTAFSISFWGKLASVTSYIVLGDLITPYSHGVSFNWNSTHLGGTIFFRCQNGSSSPYLSAPLSPDTNWHHFVITYDEGTRFIYIDGSQAATDTSGPASMPATLGDTFKIGTDNSGGSNATNGSISQVSIFDYALTSSAVTALYNGGIPSNPLAVTTPPIAYYDLGQGSAYASGSAGIVEPNLAAATGSTVFDFDDNTVIPAQAIETSFNPNGYTKATFSIWSYIPSSYNRGTFFTTYEDTANKYADNNFSFYPSRNIFYAYINGVYGSLNIGGAFGSITPDNVWNCITVVYDGTFTDADPAVQNAGRLKFYTNGVYKEFATISDNVPSSIVAPGLGSRIGARNPTSTNGSLRSPFVGELSNLQIWNESLTPTEVIDVYNNGTPLQSNIPQSGSLKAWYKLGLDTSVYNTTNTRWAIEDSSTPYNGTINFQI